MISLDKDILYKKPACVILVRNADGLRKDENHGFHLDIGWTWKRFGEELIERLAGDELNLFKTDNDSAKFDLEILSGNREEIRTGTIHRKVNAYNLKFTAKYLSTREIYTHYHMTFDYRHYCLLFEISDVFIKKEPRFKIIATRRDVLIDPGTIIHLDPDYSKITTEGKNFSTQTAFYDTTTRTLKPYVIDV
jgi:hypothetical protein